MPVDLESLRREAELLRSEWNSGQWVPYPSAYGDDCKSNAGSVAEQTLELIDEMAQARSDFHHLMHHFGAMRIQIKDTSGRQTFDGTLSEWLARENADA